MPRLFSICADYERRIRACETPEEADVLRRELGHAMDLLRTIAGLALQRAHVLRHGGDEAFQHALKTAGDPQASWPPGRVVPISKQERL